MTAQRHPNDFYPTDPRLTRALLRYMDISGRVICPCNGKGGVSKVLAAKTGSVIETWDIDPEMNPDFVKDATLRESWDCDGIGCVDWVVENPPFNQASEIAQHALKSSRDVALLLRLSFLEPVKTRRWLLKAPVSDLIVFSPRPQFRAKPGADSVTTAWFIWRWDRKDGPTNIHYCCDWQAL